MDQVWEILATGASDAQRNMAIDTELLQNASSLARPVLHLYRWARPSLTYGYFVRPEQLLDLERLARDGVDTARRPTGGGVVFHMGDLAFSVVVPAHSPLFSKNSLTNYALVNRAVLQAVQRWQGLNSLALTPEDAPIDDPLCARFCMARPTKYDLLWQGQKIAGAAQRQTQHGFLHQGTISLRALDPLRLASWLRGNRRLIDAMSRYTFAPVTTDQALEAARSQLEQLLHQALEKDAATTT